LTPTLRVIIFRKAEKQKRDHRWAAHKEPLGD
jgi:hypothetical protein